MKALDDLAALADAATPGPWRAGSVERENVFCEYGATMGPERVLLRMNREFPGFKQSAAFIAAANPQTVLALVEVVRAAGKMRDIGSYVRTLDGRIYKTAEVKDFDFALAKLEGLVKP